MTPKGTRLPTLPWIASLFTPLHRGGQGPPMVCIHGFTDTWRTWDLVLPTLERTHQVLAPTLPGHAGGPALRTPISDAQLLDALESAMDEAGCEKAHLVGNSLGGYLALHLAARGRALSVVALAPAGGWADGDLSYLDTLEHFLTMHDLVKQAAPYAEAILATPEGRRQATQFTSVNYEHIPSELLAHQLRGAADCTAVRPLVDLARSEGWSLEPSLIECPVRIVWGTVDQLLRWPSSAVRYREDWLAHAEWVVLDGVGHCPQLDVPVETAQLILGLSAA